MELSLFEKRHSLLIEMGFTIDDTHMINTYEHECGMWICDFALEQYSQIEWDGFILECKSAINKALNVK